MIQKRVKPARGNGTGLGNLQCLAACDTENSAKPSQIQEKWLAARFGLDADRARLVASLAWGRA